MRNFSCPNCGQQLSFENSLCLSCSGSLGFDLPGRRLVVIAAPGPVGDDEQEQGHLCANMHIAQCNWLVAQEGDLCASCRLTQTRPADDDAEALPLFAEAETAKRRLILELTELGLPIVSKNDDPDNGLIFELLSSERRQVLTGHANGVITLDLEEGDDVHREQLRVSMGEPYRTLLGHFRHEVGHYYYNLLIIQPERRQAFVDLFGDPDADYPQALARHYQLGAPEGWHECYVSAYATMHAAEDWAETFAHYLHIRDTLDTAAAYGFAAPDAAFGHSAETPDFDRLITLWLPVSWALNQLNRSMGHADLYPFVLPAPVLEKMRFIHQTIADAKKRALDCQCPDALT